MKNYFLITIFFILFFQVSGVFAITAGTIPGASELSISDAPQIRTVDSLVGIVKNVVRYVYVVFFIVAVGFIISAAYIFLMARENPEEINKAKRILMYAAIAIAVAFLAISVELIVRNLITSGGSGSSGSGNWMQYTCSNPSSNNPCCKTPKDIGKICWK